MPEHEIDKLARFAAHVAVHFFGLFHEIRTISHGYSVAVGKDKFLVVTLDFLHADTFRLRLVQL